MATPVRMPRLGETVVEGTVARWLKQPGEPVEKQEPLLEISTDKIDTDYRSKDPYDVGSAKKIHLPV